MPDVDLGPVVGGSNRLRGYLAIPDAIPDAIPGAIPDAVPAAVSDAVPAAVSDGDGPWPGVVVIHEAFGLNDIVRRQADRLAAAGYLALAPDLFSDGGAARCLVGTFRALFAGRGKPVADIDAARDHLEQHARCTGRVGIIGFCMGGGFALVTANRGFDAASVNYGQPPRHAEKALAGSCPIVASYGGSDAALAGAAKKLTRVLATLDVEHDVKEYPGAGHSFLNDRYFGPAPTHRVQRILHVGPNPEAAADAWRRIEAFFARHLAN